MPLKHSLKALINKPQGDQAGLPGCLISCGGNSKGILQLPIFVLNSPPFGKILNQLFLRAEAQPIQVKSACISRALVTRGCSAHTGRVSKAVPSSTRRDASSTSYGFMVRV